MAEMNLLTKLGVGQLLKARRLEIGMTHKEMAADLGYEYENYLSMIERGTTNIPLIRVHDFVEAYRLDPIFSLVILRAVYPETYTMVLEVLRSNPEITKMRFDDADAHVTGTYLSAIDNKKIKGKTVADTIPEMEAHFDEMKRKEKERREEAKAKRKARKLKAV